jgi:hypothetical protein
MNVFLQINVLDPVYFGPFNLYSDVDSFSLPFQVGVDTATLQTGAYFVAPTGTNFVRVCSVNIDYCNSCEDINIVPIITLPVEE